MHVQGDAIRTLPIQVQPKLAALFATLIETQNEDMNHPNPGVMIAMTPRCILFPVPGDDTTDTLPKTLEDRILRLTHGDAEALWNSYDWTANRKMDNEIRRVTPRP